MQKMRKHLNGNGNNCIKIDVSVSKIQVKLFRLVKTPQRVQTKHKSRSYFSFSYGKIYDEMFRKNFSKLITNFYFNLPA